MTFILGMEKRKRNQIDVHNQQQVDHTSADR